MKTQTSIGQLPSNTTSIQSLATAMLQLASYAEASSLAKYLDKLDAEHMKTPSGSDSWETLNAELKAQGTLLLGVGAFGRLWSPTKCSKVIHLMDGTLLACKSYLDHATRIANANAQYTVANFNHSISLKVSLKNFLSQLADAKYL